jgi:outer membrane lipoprotein SlyB
MAVRLTYTGTPFAEQIKQQGFKAGNPTGGFSNRLADLFQRGPKTFTAPSLDVARTYATGRGGGVIPVVSSTSNLRLPSGGIPETTIGRGFRVPSGLPKFGTEVIQTPKQATKGMDFASKLGTKYTGSRARDLLAGKTVTGLGSRAAPGFLSTAARTVLGPLSTVTLGPQVIAGLMAPKTQAGFDYMKGFDEGAITGIMDETSTAEDITNFGTGIMANDNAAIQKAALAEARMDPNVVSAIDAQTADELAQLPIDPVDNRNIFSRFKDFAVPIAKDVVGRQIASQALGGAGGMIFGPMGAIAGGLAGLFGGGNLFNSPYIEGVTTVDEFGNIISGEELDKQNALGGYYSDAARASRSRDNRIANMQARREAGKRFSAKNLAALEELQAKEEAARQAEFDAIMSSEQSQRDFYDSLNEGRGATSTAESRSTAGDAPGYSGPSPFAKGGIVGLL